jgi:hypothetical protein
MTETKLHVMVEEVGTTLVEKLFAEHGRIAAVYVIITGDNIVVVPAPPLPKDIGLQLIRQVMKAMKPDAYVYIDEAWVLSGTGPREDFPRDISEHPDRKEVVHVFGEDYETGALMARRSITRPENAPAQLGPLEFVSQDYVRMEGRMVGLLPARGRMN